MNRRVRSVLKLLASLERGELTSITTRVEEARQLLLAENQVELADRLKDSLEALQSGRIAQFRKLVANVQARVGHLKLT